MRAILFNFPVTIILLIWIKWDIWTFKCPPLCALSRCSFMAVYRCCHDLFHMDEGTYGFIRSTLEINKYFGKSIFYFLNLVSFLWLHIYRITHYHSMSQPITLSQTNSLYWLFSDTQGCCSLVVLFLVIVIWNIWCHDGSNADLLLGGIDLINCACSWVLIY